MSEGETGPWRPLKTDRGFFLGLLDELLRRDWPRSLHLCGSRPRPVPAGWQVAQYSPFPRLIVTLEGADRHLISAPDRPPEEGAQPIRLTAGEGLFVGSDGFESRRSAGRTCVGFSVVAYPDYLRLVAFELQDDPAPGSPFAYHTAHPLGAAGMALIASLDACTRTPPGPDSQRALARALLFVTRDHLLADAPADRRPGVATRHWQRIGAYLRQHLAEGSSRDQVAAFFGISPGYLSRLCRRETGETYQAHLDRLRMDQARHLLEHSDRKVAEVAALCGYASSRHFSQVFRERVGATPSAFRQRFGR